MTLLCIWNFVERGNSKTLSDEFIKKLSDKTIENLKKITLQDIANAFEKSIFKKMVIDYVLKKSPDKYRTAEVYSSIKRLEPGYSLEGTYLAERLDKNRHALQRLTGINVSQSDNVPRIGFVFSGGGYRAMIATAGYMRGFEQLGIVDVSQYIAGLSGSSWWIGPYMFMQSQSAPFSVQAFNATIADKIKVNRFNPFNSTNTRLLSAKSLGNDIVFPKIVFNQTISSVDFYGALLAHALLAHWGNERYLKRLSDQWFNVRHAHVPWPIYTAVSYHKLTEYVSSYNWYEFNPEEIRNLEKNIALPSFAFGRTFKNGRSQDFAPEPSFSLLMGIFGSAYSVNLKDIKRIVLESAANEEGYYDPDLAKQGELLAQVVELNQEGKEEEMLQVVGNSSYFETIKKELLESVLFLMSDSRIGAMRAAPAQINNPFKDYKDAYAWLQNRDQLTFIDAGISYNIPLRPLFRPERKLDLIFIGDASSNIESGDELKKALTDIKRVYNITYYLSAQESDKTVKVYRADDGQKAPVLVYINFLKDDSLLQSAQDNEALKKLIEKNKIADFDVANCLNTSYCSTFNFDYTAEQFEQLSFLAEFNVLMHKDLFINLITERMDQDSFDFGSEF